MSIPLSPRTQSTALPSTVGMLECAWDLPSPTDHPTPEGFAVIAHPHPLHGGSMDNKVVHTIARSLLQLGYATWRFNFRGVGASEGSWDDGQGETIDMMNVIKHVKSLPQAANLPLVLAGFSFGAYITTKAAQQLAKANQQAQQLILVGIAADRYEPPHVPAKTIVIHGEQDDTVPLQSVFDWARPQHLPVIVIPGAGHFFHGQLPLLKDIILRSWPS